MQNPTAQPYIVEGTGANALKIFFESEDTKRQYMEISVEHPGNDFTVNLGNPV